MMDGMITLDSIIGILGLLFGGGALGGIFTWRWQRKKAKAEAVQAEMEAAKDMQELYQKMVEDANTYLQDARNKMEGLRQERDHYKADRDELREKVDKLTKMFYELKTEGEKERAQLRVSLSAVQSQLKGIVIMTCSVQDCKMRQVINFTEGDPNRKRRQPKSIEPIEKEAL